MKRLAAIVLVIVMVFTFAACGEKEVEKSAGTDELVGGWSLADLHKLTDEQIELFNKAMAELDGVDYTPVAYIGSQVVAGTNHRFLARAKGVYPGATETYALVTIYEDLEGNLEILDIVDSGAETGISEDDGAWAAIDDNALTDEIMAAFEKATETLTGAEITPVCVVAEQIVAGTNYMIFCETKPSVAELDSGVPGYAMVTLYVDLEGNSEITDIVDFTAE
ncbi:MAG: hypothetical protein IKS99_04730 [Firmicutes bacterium]|nr:hypothetical protein [Bacillota bacterium]